jgi:hypothetical protein
VLTDGNAAAHRAGSAAQQPDPSVSTSSGWYHRLKNVGPGIGRQLGIGSPASLFEAFVAEVTAAQVDTGSPSRPSALTFREIATKHGIEFV